MQGNFVIIGHDGCEDAPPASLDSVRNAFRAGADIAEVDVRITRDGVLVLQHDDEVLLTAEGAVPGETISISESRYADLVKLEDAGRIVTPDGRGRLAQLWEALEYAREYGRLLNLDMKSTSAIEPALEVVTEREMRNSIIVSGCDADMARIARAACPGVRVLLDVDGAELTTKRRRRRRGEAIMQQWYGVIAELGCGGLNIEFPYCSAELVEFFHDRFVPVAVWTVDDAEQMNALLETGVHSVTTNRVSRLVELRNNPGLVTKRR